VLRQFEEANFAISKICKSKLYSAEKLKLFHLFYTVKGLKTEYVKKS
jgi:hypothetical protein